MKLIEFNKDESATIRFTSKELATLDNMHSFFGEDKICQDILCWLKEQRKDRYTQLNKEVARLIGRRSEALGLDLPSQISIGLPVKKLIDKITKREIDNIYDEETD